MFVTDTHPLVWFVNGKTSKLTKKVLRAFQDADMAKTVVYVPAVVLWEIALIEKAGQIKLDDRVVSRILCK